MSASHARGAAGAPLGHAQVLAIALPIILANVTTPLLGIVDTAVLGQLGAPHHIGAVAVGAMIFNMLYWTFGFLRMGTTGLTAQADGGGDGAEVAATLLRALAIAGVCGVGVIALQAPVAALAFYLIDGSQPVEAGAAAYFEIRIWSAPAALANYAFLGWFIGLGRARTALLLQVLLNGTNAALDALFVLGFGWGIEGVALGTLLAELFAAGCGAWIAFRLVAARGPRPGLAQVLYRDALRRIVAVNTDIMIRTLLILFAFAWFTAKSAESGDVVLAANAVLMQFTYFAAYFLDGFAFATETLVGQSIGARTRERFRRALRLSSQWAGALSLALGLGFWLAGGHFIDLLTVNPEVRETARDYLFWAALGPVMGVACFQLDGIFIGATRTADMRNMMIVSVAVYLAAWAVLTALYANHGLWAALIVFYLIRAVTLGARLPALERDAFGAPNPHTRPA